MYRVYSYNLMRYLETLGFKVIKTKQMEEEPSKTIWYYKGSPELLEAINYYVKAKQQVD